MGAVISDVRQATRKIAVRAAIYARFSSDMQNPESANDQIARVRYYTEKQQLRLIKFPQSEHVLEFSDDWILKDEAESGRVADRHGYELLLQGIRSRKFDVVIVDDLSRLTRSLGDQIHLYNLLRFKGVELYSVCEGISSESPNAKMFFQIKGLVNELSNELNALRTKRGQEARVLKGYSSGDICYGYYSQSTQTRTTGGREVPSHYEIHINQEEAKVVNLIFDLKIKGLGKAAIAQELNKRGIVSTSRGRKITGRTHNWSQTLIGKMLEREKYIGIWRWGKSTRVQDPDSRKMTKQDVPQNQWVEHFEGKEVRADLAIVPLEKWTKVQDSLSGTKQKFREGRDRAEVMREAKQAATKSKTLLAGILRCGECGSPMLQITSGFFGCFLHHRKDKSKCSNKRMIKTSKIDIKVMDALKEVLLDPEYLKQAADLLNEKIRLRLNSAPEEIKTIEKKKSILERETQNLLKLVMTHGDFSIVVRETLEAKERELTYLQERTRLLQTAKIDKLFVTSFALKARYENLVEHLSKDPVMSNAALRKLIPEGLKCIPRGIAKGQNCNQNNSSWEVEGTILVAPGAGFSNLTNGGGDVNPL
ncbi:MAG: recombinase family protein [Bdellovibrionaceae bacterium]|nr:recombinase family protein [Pseudobdellovibrionaceae bacterium]